MAREFNIYLNNRLTKGKLIIFAIPYRASIIVSDGIVLDSSLAGYTLQKFTSGGSVIELGSEVEELTKVFSERLGLGVQIGFGADSQIYYVIYPVQTGASGPVISISPSLEDLFYRRYFSVSSSARIGLSIAEAEFYHSLGGWDGEIALGFNGVESAQKLVAVPVTVQVAAEAEVSMARAIEPGEASLAIPAEAYFILRRYRLLSEMDEDELATYDDMTLDDAYYVIL